MKKVHGGTATNMTWTSTRKIHEESAMGTAAHYMDFEKSKMQGGFEEYITVAWKLEGRWWFERERKQAQLWFIKSTYT